MDINAGHTDKLSDCSVLHRDHLPPDRVPIQTTVSYNYVSRFLNGIAAHGLRGHHATLYGPSIMSELIKKHTVKKNMFTDII